MPLMPRKVKAGTARKRGVRHELLRGMPNCASILAMTRLDTAARRAKMPALTAVAVVVVVLLGLRYVLQIDVWYVLTGGMPWVLAAETGIVGFVLGWVLAKRR